MCQRARHDVVSVRSYVTESLGIGDSKLQRSLPASSLTQFESDRVDCSDIPLTLRVLRSGAHSLCPSRVLSGRSEFRCSLIVSSRRNVYAEYVLLVPPYEYHHHVHSELME